jgi:sortase A
MKAKEETGVKKKRSKVNILINIFIALVFLGGMGTLLYPTVSDMWNRYRQSLLIADYQNAVQDLSEKDYDQIWKDAEDYNKNHTVNNIVDAFDEEDRDLTHPYDTLLNPNQDGIMGYLQIPKIQVKLAIYHGTNSDVLEKGVGHMEGTSLPIGGENTHAALSGHRGLPSARLFTDLDQMAEGDVFYITVLDKILEYQVDQILVVDPSDSSALAIVPGEDHVTLVTCTPYAVNTHRLLVRGTRIEYDGALDEADNSSPVSDLMDTFTLRERIVLLVAGVIIVIILILIIRKIVNRKKHKKVIKE